MIVTSGEKGSQFFRFGGSQYRLPSVIGRRSASLPGIKANRGVIAAGNKKNVPAASVIIFYQQFPERLTFSQVEQM